MPRVLRPRSTTGLPLVRGRPVDRVGWGSAGLGDGDRLADLELVDVREAVGRRDVVDRDARQRRDVAQGVALGDRVRAGLDRRSRARVDADGLRHAAVVRIDRSRGGTALSACGILSACAALGASSTAGGGVALIQAGKAAFDDLSLTGDEATGANIVKVGIEAPLKQIATNAGLEAGVVADKVANLEPGWGLNAATGEYEDLLAAGINDPVKVTRSALQNAASIAGLFLTTESVVADKPEKAAPGADAAAAGMDGMGGMGF